MDPASDLDALGRMIEMCVSKLRVLEGDIAALEAQKERLEGVIDRLVEAKKDLGSLGIGPTVLPPEDEWPQPDSPQKTAFERVVEFLRAQGNPPLTIGQIEHGTRLKRSSVSAVLYRTHANYFYVREHSGKQPNTWQLKESLVDSGPDTDSASPRGDEIPF